ncbi:MAG TPA: hypothetical protein P5217_08520 [Methanoregulaceae archaeon]|nr:hypothetical protein [Methanoregulaceae archaeon]HRY76312.1 hypothetical protein [Methanoregulaceae archaeon]
MGSTGRYLGIVLIVLIILGLLAVFWPNLMKRDAGGAGDYNFNSPVTLEDINTLQLEGPANYIGELERISTSHPDPYIRQRSVTALTEIAIRKNETDKIESFLKDIALNTKDSQLRTAAYANIDLIRSIHPPEQHGKMNITVDGIIRQGQNIRLIVTILSTKDVPEATFGLYRLPADIPTSSKMKHKLILQADKPQTVQFDLQLQGTGEYMIPVFLMLSFDRVDYEVVEQLVYFKVETNNGEYRVLGEPTNTVGKPERTEL